VHPQYGRIAAWISAVGAAGALNDIDADGLPNDICLVDVRTNQVEVLPAPGTGARYAPFVLDPAPLPYDTATTAPMGCLPGDLNEDGALDLLVYYWGRTPIAFLARPPLGSGRRSLGPESFVPREIVAGSQRWFTNAATLADLDGDGHLDLVVGNYFPDGAHVLDSAASEPAHMQHSMSRAFNGGRKHFLRWTGASAGDDPTVRFADDSGGLGDDVARGWTLAVAAADLDGDLLPELYLANDFGPDRLLHNRSTPGHIRFVPVYGQRTAATPSSKVLGRDSFKGMGVDFGDLDGDGRLDICVSNIADEYALEESHFLFVNTGHAERMREGVAPFVDRSEALGLARGGWGWDCRFADLDDDGTLEVLRAAGFVRGSVNRWPELHELAMGNDELLASPASWPAFTPGADISGHDHDRLLVRDRGGRYVDVAAEVGLGDAQVTRGVATADVDGDGRLDILLANQWGDSRFYRNESPHPGAFLGLRLRLPVAGGNRGSGAPPSRPAVGAQATLHLSDGRVMVAQVDGGNGHSGKRSNDLHFGLGALGPNTPVRVDLRWRDAHGAPRAATLDLRPGWHVLMLGESSSTVTVQ
jgi:hypothetical protein